MKKIKKNLKLITIMIVMIILIVGILIKYSLSNSTVEEVSMEDLELEDNEEIIMVEEENSGSLKVYVDIKGAVNNPGVYEIEEDKKVIDVVELAGGFTGQADTSMINLAKKVSDEMVIIIYTIDEVKKAQEENTIIKIVDQECVCPEISNDACLKEEVSKNSDDKDSTSNTETNTININSATIEELLTLSGIGESKAKAIIEYREENGNFKNIEDIMNVPGIGEALYEKIKDNITV